MSMLATAWVKRQAVASRGPILRASSTRKAYFYGPPFGDQMEVRMNSPAFLKWRLRIRLKLDLFFFFSRQGLLV